MRGDIHVTEVFYEDRNQEQTNSSLEVSSFHLYLLSPQVKKHERLKPFSWLYN